MAASKVWIRLLSKKMMSHSNSVSLFRLEPPPRENDSTDSCDLIIKLSEVGASIKYFFWEASNQTILVGFDCSHTSLLKEIIIIIKLSSKPLISFKDGCAGDT